MHDDFGGHRRASPAASAANGFSIVVSGAVTIFAAPWLYQWTHVWAEPLLLRLYGPGWARFFIFIWGTLCALATFMAIRTSVLLMWSLIVAAAVTYGWRVMPLLAAA